LRDIAVFVPCEKHRLPEHLFIDDMAAHFKRSTPTMKQAEYLHSLFFKLGEKIT
jgi:hypothetical protein